MLSNIYLHPLDQQMKARCWEMVRYAVDFVILATTRDEAEEALGQVRAWVSDNGLSLHETKTGVVDVREAEFDFLGYRFEKHYRFPRKKSLAKFRDAIRVLTPRTSGKSLSEIVSKLNEKLRGWHVYFQHAWWTVFRDQDSWVRGRLRSLLRKRSKRRGRGRGTDHQRWPNAYFASRGLYSLKEAHTRACQSSWR